MANYNPDISNGTCYYADGEEAPSRFIPCGNEAIGHKACCESLDMCLSSSACYNGQYGVTYLAGCTDSTYDDPRCPDKGDFSGQTWAGLVYCNGTSNEWVACEDSGATVSSPEPCWCPSTSRTVAFTDAPQLTNIMSLPNMLGASVTWMDRAAYESEHSLTLTTSAVSQTSDPGSITTLLPPVSVPTTLSPTTSSTSSSSTSSANTTSIAPATPASVTNSSGLGTGQKIGIALGSAGGVVSMLLLGWLVAKRMRGQKKKHRSTPPMVDLSRPHPEISQTEAEMRSPSWSGHKSELPADESTNLSPSPNYQEFQRPLSGEVEGSPSRLSPTRATYDGGYRMPGHKGTYYEMPG
ncbi:hypothetical protein A1O3_09560 [Capronia epimyces CBS 606.96]|uniref:Mid2 domain-containing protein n=1 Tax=Capronia epimyces CBS 606.96 TaxID=1182542 RepID=W9Y4H0_9EURO|nr:uncharacterized protein A1O3_09560 [Capronia epimyces CBS 606.96]EXJ77334.1 hypothetical protein A1O3_09560 [Capronia epimyces CBS 606.96]